jgi:RND family efflux transporter MFP subunit
LKLSRGLAGVVLLLLTMSVLGGCALFPKEEDALAPPLVQPKKQTYETAKVTRGTIEQVVHGNGTFVSASVYPVYFTEDGRRIKTIDVNVGDTVKKGQVLLTTEIGDLDTQIELQQCTVQLRELDLKRAYAGSDAIAKQEAQINLKIEQIKLDDLQTQMAEAKLVSPVDGKITYVSDLKAGDVASAYQAILTVGDTKKLKISFESTDSNLLNVGMKAQITANGTTVTGTVSSIPSPDATDSSNDQSQDQTGVGISLDKVLSGVSIGDFGDVEIVIARKDNTLIIPKRAVQHFMSDYTVDVWNGTSKKEFTITTGIQSDTNIEVLSGLSEGQNVILN